MNNSPKQEPSKEVLPSLPITEMLEEIIDEAGTEVNDSLGTNIAADHLCCELSKIIKNVRQLEAESISKARQEERERIIATLMGMPWRFSPDDIKDIKEVISITNN